MYVNPAVAGADDNIPTNQEWTIGNIGLKPFVSTQFDLSIEYYFAEGSVFSAAFFFKDVKNFVTVNESHADTASIPFAGVLRPGEVTSGWTVFEKINGKKAKIKGVEFQYQQEFDNGFGVVMNYTFTDSKAKDNQTFSDGQRVLSDASKHSANISGYYEDEDFSARVSYNFRSAYMIRDGNGYGNRLHESYGAVDMSAKYHYSDNITISLDVNNLFPQNSVQTGNNAQITPRSGNTPGFPLYEYETSRRIGLGISFKY
jgi:iron complex outermembrane receptor protein